MAAQVRSLVAKSRQRTSKSHTVATPAYASILQTARKVEGALVRDALGLERVDFRNGDGCVLLGWGDPRVEAAVARTPATCSGKLEAEAAERVGDLIPSAEAVGFRSSLESALVDALVAAKTVTGRDGAFFCDDETAVSGDLSALHDALDRHLGEVAALVIRPMDASREFLLGARALTERTGVVLVFDESRTAFRVDLGGAQTLAGVMPDMTVLGASLANGRPIAAVCGKLEPMSALTSTGDIVTAAALAATCATLDRVVRDDVPDVLRVRGAEIEAEVEARLAVTGADEWLSVYGDPTWSLVAARPRAAFDGKALEDALASALYHEGVLSFGAHVPSLASREGAVSRLLAAYDDVLPAIVERCKAGGFARARRRSVAA
ncbi:MAG TPA: aminotransferase class III-fold pyridoxal phosphate-dependent enzyme [Caulobacteraceae bacterium]|jgi:glutamate-1-semialdehyde 2,1-aminomutase|nr:aminotransferase class III-fold pyridoxal phosphate-dependent enzyme [Caulobacteraceae bacterium]